MTLIISINWVVFIGITILCQSSGHYWSCLGLYLLDEGPYGNKRKQPEFNEAKGSYWRQLREWTSPLTTILWQKYENISRFNFRGFILTAKYRENWKTAKISAYTVFCTGTSVLLLYLILWYNIYGTSCNVVVLFHLFAIADKIYGNHCAPGSVESLIKYAFPRKWGAIWWKFKRNTLEVNLIFKLTLKYIKRRL